MKTKEDELVVHLDKAEKLLNELYQGDYANELMLKVYDVKLDVIYMLIGFNKEEDEIRPD